MKNDLISRSALLEEFGEEPYVWDSRDREQAQERNDWEYYTSMVEDAPAVEAEPVRHGRWEECDWVEYDGHSECVRYPKKGRVCTYCRNAFKKEFIDSPRVHYCPHCGAKMDGGGDDDQA